MVRAAVEGDLDEAVQLMWDVASEGRWIGTEVPFDRVARRASFAASVEADDGAVLVAHDADLLVGGMWLHLAPYGVVELGMFVRAGHRGQGVGRALLDAGVEWARSVGAHKVALQVWPHNDAALALYRRAGFVEEGRLLRHYRRRNGELWDAVVMGLLL